MHGVIGLRWVDYTANRPVSLLGDEENPSPDRLIVPTLAETLLQQAPGSQAVTIAAEPASAVVTSGRGGAAYWLDAKARWASSPAYVETLPDWVARSNRENYNTSYVATEWRTLYGSDRYRNERRWDVAFPEKRRERRRTASGG